MTANTDTPAGVTTITDRQQVTLDGLTWTVNQFDNGQRYMLTASTTAPGTQFSVHFDADHWAAFQALVAS